MAIIERATTKEPRLVAVTKSAIAFYERRRLELQKLIEVFSRNLYVDNDPYKRDEKIAELNGYKEELRVLESGWQNSSLRRKLEKESERSQKPEHRLLTTSPGTFLPTGTVRASSKKITLKGYAAVFNSVSELLYGSFIETIAPGAFSSALKRGDLNVVGLVNHDSNLAFSRHLASRSNQVNTLRLYEDFKGLLYYSDLDENDGLMSMIIQRVATGTWFQNSFSFTVKRDEWKFASGPGKYDRRRILEIEELFDVSLVTTPAYKEALATLLYEDRSPRTNNISTSDDDGQPQSVQHQTSPKDLGLSFEQKFNHSRNVRKAQRLRNRLCIK